MTSCTVLYSGLGPMQTLNPFILLQYQSWHKPAVVSSVALSGEWPQASLNTPASEWTRLNDVGEKKWRATEGVNKEREGGFFLPLGWVPNLAALACICTLFEKQRLHLQRDLPVCLGLGNVSCMPPRPPPPLPNWGHVESLLFWPGHSVESAVLTRHCQDLSPNNGPLLL